MYRAACAGEITPSIWNLVVELRAALEGLLVILAARHRVRILRTDAFIQPRIATRIVRAELIDRQMFVPLLKIVFMSHCFHRFVTKENRGAVSAGPGATHRRALRSQQAMCPGCQSER